MADEYTKNPPGIRPPSHETDVKLVDPKTVVRKPVETETEIKVTSEQ
jgi:hypothetical protein